MLGLGDGWVSTAYILCILSAVACAVYGILNWNRGSEDESRQVEEEKKWEEKEQEIEEKL